MRVNDISRVRGDTLTPEKITIIDKTTGLPKDITGATFIMTVTTIADPPDDSTKLFDVVGVPKVDQVEFKGQVEFHLSDSNADNVGDFFYDAQMTSGGKPTTPIDGLFEMTQDRTK